MCPHALLRIDYTVHKVRFCHNRLDCSQINVAHLRKMSIFITLENVLGFPAMFFQIRQRSLIDLHQRCLCTCLHTEIADRNPVAHIQCLQPFSAKLHRHIVCAVCADHANDRQDEIPRIDTILQFSCQMKFQCFRYQQPRFACHHRIEIICTAHTRSKCTNCPIRTGMAVRAKDQLSARDMILHHHLMAHTCAFIEFDAMFLCKITHLLM